MIFHRCRHQFRIISVAHTEPVVMTAEKVGGAAALVFLQRMSYGFTHVVQRCGECGEFKQDTLHGIHSIPVADKAEGILLPVED